MDGAKHLLPPGVLLIAVMLDVLVVFACIFTFASLATLAWALTPFVRIVLGCTPQGVVEIKRCSKPTRTSFVSTLAFYFLPLKNREDDSPSLDEEFRDIILPGETKERLLGLTSSASNSHDNSFSHAVFHGPDNVAMSIAAKRLARVLGVDFAHVSGRKINEAEQTSTEEVVSQIQTLFSWARKSSNGMLLFIDESDTFLKPKGPTSNDTNTHDGLSSFLFNLRRIQKDIMLVLATNRVDDLDLEVLDCCDSQIFFSLPNSRCRKELIQLHFDICFQKYIERLNTKACSLRSRILHFLLAKEQACLSVDDDVLVGEQLEEAIAATRGLSGGDIKLMMDDLRQQVLCSGSDRLESATAWKLIEHYHQNCQAVVEENILSYPDGDIDLQDITFV